MDHQSKGGGKLIATLAENTGMITRDFNVGEYDITVEATGLDNYNVVPDLTNVNLTKGAVATVAVNIAKRPVESITLSPSREGSLNLGDTLKLTPTITPEHATEQTITWTSNNESVAKVDANGNVTTQGTPGTTEIKAEIDGKSATYTVTVDDEITISGKLQLFAADLSHVIDSSGITIKVEVDGKEISSTTSGSSGQFEVNDVPRGKLVLKFSKDTNKDKFNYGVDNFDLSDDKEKRNVGNIWLLPISAHKSSVEDNPYQIEKFGSYKNLNTLTTWDGQWRVLDRVDNKVLLVSSVILFNHEYSGKDASTWDESSLKTYLNGDFYNNTFDDSEKVGIIDEGMGKVFVLSVAEAKQYFDNDTDRAAQDLGKTSVSLSTWNWRLRSDESTGKPPIVHTSGYIALTGDNESGGKDTSAGIRPAMWVSLGNY